MTSQSSSARLCHLGAQAPLPLETPPHSQDLSSWLHPLAPQAVLPHQAGPTDVNHYPLASSRRREGLSPESSDGASPAQHTHLGTQVTKSMLVPRRRSSRGGTTRGRFTLMCTAWNSAGSRTHCRARQAGWQEDSEGQIREQVQRRNLAGVGTASGASAPQTAQKGGAGHRANPGLCGL